MPAVKLGESVRQELARLLRRIENDIAPQENINKLWQLCEQEQITFEYLQGFMAECLLKYQYTLERLAASVQTAEKGQPDPGKIAFILCVNDDSMFREAALYLQHLNIPAGMEAEIIPVRGAASMCHGYEQGRQASNARYKIYLHQDVLVIRKNIVHELLALFQDAQVGLIGLAGCEKLPDSGIWWDGGGVHNIIAHALDYEHMIAVAGTVPCCEVQAADGVFLATQYDIPWQADWFKGWHFYDISLCQEYRKKGYKVMLPRQEESWIIHQTSHTHAQEDYYDQQEIFLQHYYPFC